MGQFLKARKDPYGRIIEEMMRRGVIRIQGFDKAGTLCKYAKRSRAFDCQPYARDRFVMIPRRILKKKRELRRHIVFEII